MVNVSSTDTSTSSLSSLTNETMINLQQQQTCATCIRAITATNSTTTLNSLESLTIRSSGILPIKCKNPEHNKNIINQTITHTINSVAFKSTLRAKKVQKKTFSI